jgi:hypothetical protein
MKRIIFPLRHYQKAFTLFIGRRKEIDPLP